MRKTLAQCCAALLVAPILTLMLIGTAALAAEGGGLARSGSSAGSSSNTSSNGTDSSDDGSSSSQPEVKKSVTITTESPVYTGVNLPGTILEYVTEPADQPVAWESKDPEIASVDNYTRRMSAHKPCLLYTSPSPRD